MFKFHLIINIAMWMFFFAVLKLCICIHCCPAIHTFFLALNPLKMFRINKKGPLLACVASVSVWFRSKERPRNGILGFGRARNETRAKKMKVGGGGRE